VLQVSVGLCERRTPTIRSLTDVRWPVVCAVMIGFDSIECRTVLLGCRY
jgi:hypothetical protein